MKTLILIIAMFPLIVNAGQLSISTVDVQAPNNWTYVSSAETFQLNIGDDDYFFVGYEQLHVCPWYCGVKFDLVSIGGGTHIDYEKIRLFAQAGLYLVKNSADHNAWNENLYYYMVGRFNGMKHERFSEFRVDSNNGFGVTVGAEIPFTENTGLQIYYRHLQFWVNYVAYLSDGGYWHDPSTLRYNGYGVGLYYNF